VKCGQICGGSDISINQLKFNVYFRSNFLHIWLLRTVSPQSQMVAGLAFAGWF